MKNIQPNCAHCDKKISMDNAKVWPIPNCLTGAKQVKCTCGDPNCKAGSVCMVGVCHECHAEILNEMLEANNRIKEGALNFKDSNTGEDIMPFNRNLH